MQTLPRAKDQPPNALVLVLLDLGKLELHVASFKLALMLHILDHGESKQALALTHRPSAGGAVRRSLPVS